MAGTVRVAWSSYWKGVGDMGVFARIIAGQVSEGGEEKLVMIDATYLFSPGRSHTPSPPEVGRPPKA